MQISNEAIDYALERFIAWRRLQQTRDTRNERAEALSLFAQAVGLEPDERRYLGERLKQIIDITGGELGWCFLGVIIGLFMAEHSEQQWETFLSSIRPSQ